MRQHVMLSASAAGLLVTGCIGFLGGDAPPTETGPCVVDDGAGAPFEPVLRVAGVELSLDENSGGPLRCRPTAEPCAELEACVGQPIEMPVGEPATLTILVRTLSDDQGFATAPFFNVELAGDPRFSLLEPIPTSGDLNGDVPIFVGVIPAEGDAAVDVTLTNLVAVNAPADGSGLTMTLTVRGVVG